MKNGVLSVIIPVYKVELYLDDCVKSVVNQTYTQLEIILVDDGSPDNCPAMCDNWALKDNRIKVIHKVNGGLSDARNAGLKIATGEYVAFLDSDDWINESYYEVLINALINNHCDIVSGGYEVVFSRESKKIISDSGKTIVLDKNEAMSKLIDESLLKHVVWNKIYKRSLINDVLFEVGKCHEDVFWTYQVIGKAQRIAVVDYKGLFYFQREDSIMGSSFSVRRLDAVEARSHRQVYLEKHFPALAYKGCIELHFSCIYFGQQAIRNMNFKDSKEFIKALKCYTSKHPISLKVAKSQGLVRMVFLLIEKLSLSCVCRLRNTLGIGM